MNFGSEYVLVDLVEETEEIYQDEVEDGIAAGAAEQARLWALAAAESRDGVEKSQEFINELVAMTTSYDNQKKTRAGGMGTTTRLQPRYQKGKQQQFDQHVQQMVNEQMKVSHQKQQATRQKISTQNDEFERQIASMGLKTEVDNSETTFNINNNNNEDGEYHSIMIDIGSGMSKAGFSGDDGNEALKLLPCTYDMIIH